MTEKWFDKLNNIKGGKINGIYPAFPGFNQGPTLANFSFNHAWRKSPSQQFIEAACNPIPYGDDYLKPFVDKELHIRGGFYGAITETEIKNVGKLNAVYWRDSEGNIIVIQS